MENRDVTDQKIFKEDSSYESKNFGSCELFDTTSHFSRSYGRFRLHVSENREATRGNDV